MIKELESLDGVIEHITEHGLLSDVAVQEVDLSTCDELFVDLDVSNSFFLGCCMSPAGVHAVQQAGAYVFQSPPNYPFRPFRSTLYSPGELYDSFEPSDPCSYCECTDAKIYRFWKETGRETVTSIVDAMYRGIHDRSVNDALYEFLESAGKKVIAIMGGHSLRRNDPTYRDITVLSRTLSRHGYLMISGGGPGAMEATHLGAMLAQADDWELDVAVGALSKAPSYRDKEWLSTAIHVKLALKERGVAFSESLGIPTWLYGHEPPTPFATHIAKFFNNSIREEGLVTVAHAGIIFAPGSAGTIQEIFQDAAQNHYATTGYASPMIFLGKEFWTETRPVYAVLEAMSEERSYRDNLFVVDTVDEAVNILSASQPIAVPESGWNFCQTFCGE